MALITNAIGVHTVLGAFVAGILVGQSPILTRHIDEQLRGLIVALFMPVFFGLAGLTTNLTVLADPDLPLLTLGLIAIASLGKFSGAFLGGRLGGMTWRGVAGARLRHERARLDRGHRRLDRALDGRAQPEPLHDDRRHGRRHDDVDAADAALGAARLPMRPEEEARLEREEFEAQGFVPSIERLLVAVDASADGQARLAARRPARRRRAGMPTTIVAARARAADRVVARTPQGKSRGGRQGDCRGGRASTRRG